MEKNIFTRATSKPSRLYNIVSINKLELSADYLQEVEGGVNKNIYITSNEKIKEGYYYDLTLNIVMNAVFYPASDKNCKKIVLTTDRDLIKEGVQAVPDEFLEWFVNNSDCEFVKVTKLDYLSFAQYRIYNMPEDQHVNDCQFVPTTNTTSATICASCGQEKFLHNSNFSLRNTVEEMAELYRKIHSFRTKKDQTQRKEGFIDGALVMAKSMYSAEELKSAFKIGFNIGYGSPASELDLKEEHCQKWFEQFKKK